MQVIISVMNEKAAKTQLAFYYHLKQIQLRLAQPFESTTYQYATEDLVLAA